VPLSEHLEGHEQPLLSNVASESGPVLEITGLTKRFFGILALDNVGMSVSAGEIHALVGENGAGKSTLIKILAGVHAPDAGRIRLGGSDVHPHLHKLPLSFVHQDLGLVDDLSVGENVALVAGFPRRAGLIDWGRVWSRAAEIYRAMGVAPPDPRMPVGGLSAASKAVLGIVRALSRRAEVVVLDEPTASLPEPDAQHLFGVLRRLRATGTGIIYVTHRLNELFGFADRITVLRDGRHVRTAATSEMTPSGLVQDMLGRPVETLHAPHVASGRAMPIVEVDALRIQGIGPLSFQVAAGEIVGLVGLQGAGHEMIGRAIFGALRPHAGEIRLDGAVLPPDDGIPERIGRGIAMLAGDRGRESALPGMSVQENLLPNPAIVGCSPWRIASPGEERRRTSISLERLDVRPADPTALIEWLSGGNQQKVFVGRWLAAKAKLYVMEEPTAGVDIGAKFAIHKLLRDVADNGAAILVVSSDFEEVATLCDRALVISRGLITSELHGAGLTVDTVLARASLGAGHAAAG
jgi:ribose transport system ATP-binding protein